MAYRFRALLHRVITPNSMDQQEQNLSDDSRPALARPEGCIGIYLDAFDARPDRNTEVGSQHAFLMSVMDNMLDHFRSLDLSSVKGEFENRKLGNGMILEEFKNGCVLVVTFNTIEALDDFWSLHEKRRLSLICQDIFVNKSLLKAVKSSKLTLRARLWEDEYASCKDEIQNRKEERLRVQEKENDLKMVKRIKEHQSVMTDILLKARDAEAYFEHNLGTFMMCIKRALPNSTTSIKTLKEFSTNMKVARGLRKSSSGFETIDQFFESIDLMKQIFQEIERSIVFPLCQVRAQCETQNQQNLKKAIKNACAEILTVLKPEVDLQKVRHKEWESKVLKREQAMFYGLISLIPMSFDRLTTIDVNVDEYINDFPDLFS